MLLSKKIIYFTVSQFLFYRTHLGFFSKFLDSSLNFFLLKSYNFYFFNLHFTIFYFRLALNIIKQLISKKSSVLLSIPFHYNFLFQYLNNVKSLNYISNNWIPGLLTNFKNVRHFRLIQFIKFFPNLNQNIFNNLTGKKKFFLVKLLYQYFFFKTNGYFFNFINLLPSFICFFNIEKNLFGINEAFSLNLPFLTFLDINLNVWSTKYIIPGNSKTPISLNFYYFLITKSIFIGFLTEKLNFLFLIHKYNFSYLNNNNWLLSWFFYLDFLKNRNILFLYLLFNFNYYIDSLLNFQLFNYFKKFLYIQIKNLKKK